MVRQILRATGVVGFTVLMAMGCGGGGGSAPPKLPNVAFQCEGDVTDGNGHTLSLPVAPGSSAPALAVCALKGTGTDVLVPECTTKCQNNLQAYADAINNSTTPSPMVMMGQLTCNIVDAEQEANDCSGVTSSALLASAASPISVSGGGPAQYVGSLSGNLHLDVNISLPIGSTTASADSPVAAQIGYTILPLDLNCPEVGCELLITSFPLAVNDFHLTDSIAGINVIDHLVQNMRIQSVNWIVGTWQPNGQFFIPANSASITVTAIDNGQPTSFQTSNSSAITGTIDPFGGTISFNSFAQNDSDTTATISLSGANVSSPPTAVISQPGGTVECNQKNNATVTLDGSGSTAGLGAGISFYAWSVNGGAPLSGPQVATTLNLGPNNVVLNVFSSTLGVGVANQTTTVVDTTKPTFGSTPAITDTLCDPTSQNAVIPTPTATDVCSATVTVTGVVISSNGKTLNPPVPVANGGARLVAGTSVIQWSATDASGNVATTTQTVTVRPAIEASDAIAIDDRAQMKVQGSGFAELGNSGHGTVNVGVQSQAGTILAQGDVFLRDRSIVNGSVLAAGAITTQNQVTVTGSSTQHTTVSLPPGRDLAGVVFPPTNAGDVDLEPKVSRTLGPGAYGSVAVKTSATLTLTAGTYFFTALDLEPGAKLNLNQSAGAIHLFVKSSIIDRGQIATTAGSASGFVLGYAGTSTFFVQSPFPAGTVIAPNASVVVTSLGPTAFAGQLSAKDIEVQPDAVFTCTAVPGATP